MINNRLANALNYSNERQQIRATGGGFIYFIECEGYVKIGLTANHVTERVAQMQTGCPFELKLLKVIVSRNMRRDEGVIHEMFGQYRHRGEWFKLPPAAMALVNQNHATNPSQCAVEVTLDALESIPDAGTARLKRGWKAYGVPPTCPLPCTLSPARCRGGGTRLQE